MEGVEGESQVAFFRDLGCARVQGFYFSPAVSFEQLETMLSEKPFLFDK